MFTKKRIIILGIIVVVGFILGRLAFRTFLNILVGGTLFGGNILWVMKKRKEKECIYLFVY